MGTLIGYAAAPLKAELLAPWAASFRQVCPQDKIILLADPIADYESLAASYGVYVVEANLHTGSEPNSVWKDRWTAVARLLIDDNEKVLLTDTRDVFFQRNPFEQIGDKITVATEGLLFKEDEWNRSRLEKFFERETEKLLDQPTICAGVVGGPWSLLRELASDVAYKCGVPDSDQAALNLVLRDLYTHEWEAIPFTSGWCCHAAQMLSPWSIGKERREERPILLYTGHLATRAGIPFAVVHHWPMSILLRHFGEVK